jgi:hypothetical protein
VEFNSEMVSWFVRGYATREFVKLGLQPGELTIFSGEKVCQVGRVGFMSLMSCSGCQGVGANMFEDVSVCQDH